MPFFWFCLFVSCQGGTHTSDPYIHLSIQQELSSVQVELLLSSAHSDTHSALVMRGVAFATLPPGTSSSFTKDAHASTANWVITRNTHMDSRLKLGKTRE